jgi:hypothetical protein
VGATLTFFEQNLAARRRRRLFFNAVIQFLIVSFAVFWLIKALMRRRLSEDPGSAAPDIEGNRPGFLRIGERRCRRPLQAGCRLPPPPPTDEAASAAHRPLDGAVLAASLIEPPYQARCMSRR